MWIVFIIPNNFPGSMLSKKLHWRWGWVAPPVAEVGIPQLVRCFSFSRIHWSVSRRGTWRCFPDALQYVNVSCVLGSTSLNLVLQISHQGYAERKDPLPQHAGNVLCSGTTVKIPLLFQPGWGIPETNWWLTCSLSSLFRKIQCVTWIEKLWWIPKHNNWVKHKLLHHLWCFKNACALIN